MKFLSLVLGMVVVCAATAGAQTPSNRVAVPRPGLTNQTPGLTNWYAPRRRMYLPPFQGGPEWPGNPVPTPEAPRGLPGNPVLKPEATPGLPGTPIRTPEAPRGLPGNPAPKPVPPRS